MDLSTLGDRAWERGRLSVAARLRRLRDKAWMIGQCAVAAGHHGEGLDDLLVPDGHAVGVGEHRFEAIHFIPQLSAN